MADNDDDGWQGSVMALRQNGHTVIEFGADFLDGSTSPPIYVDVMKGVNLDLILVIKG